MATEAAAPSGLQFHPMDQFMVKPLFGGDTINFYTPTNVTLWMALAVLCVIGLLVLGTRGRAIVPNRIQSIAELAYGFVYKMVEDVAGKDGLKYFPYIMTLFIFIVFANFLGLIADGLHDHQPHRGHRDRWRWRCSCPSRSLASSRTASGSSALFWISAAPLVLRPILAMIEIISYFVRPVSHSIRLAGNMMAGHAVIKVFAGFAGDLLGIGRDAHSIAQSPRSMRWRSSCPSSRPMSSPF